MTVELRRLTAAAEEGWSTLFDLAGIDLQSWVLVGGQMMLVLAIEYGAERIRPTDDVDIVVNLRIRPDGTEWLSAWLEEHGFRLEGVSPEQIGHRFVRRTAAGLGNVAFDVLAPAGVGRRARLTTVPPARTVEAPATLEAFERSRVVDVLISDVADTREHLGRVRCPDLLGALVAKAAATAIPVTCQPGTGLAGRGPAPQHPSRPGDNVARLQPTRPPASRPASTTTRRPPPSLGVPQHRRPQEGRRRPVFLDRLTGPTPSGPASI